MKERGILFTPENYGRIALGQKSQTRRIIKPEWWRCLAPEDDDDRAKAITQCPYGTVGDRLYVKESHAIMSIEGSSVGVAYKNRLPKGKTLADTDGGLDLIQVDDETLRWAVLKADSERWRSPLFMPKWAARLWLELTDVRVERLQDINNDDAEAEGCQARDGFDPYEVYAELWDSIHGDGSWNTNPWLWVLTFKQVTR